MSDDALEARDDAEAAEPIEIGLSHGGARHTTYFVSLEGPNAGWVRASYYRSGGLYKANHWAIRTIPFGSATHARAIAAAKAKRDKAEAVRQRTRDNAPAMLEALRALLEWRSRDGMDAWDRARALVEEIEGEG